MENKLPMDIFVLKFVQTVSAPQTHAKRLRVVRRMIQTCPEDLTITHWMQLWRGFYYVVWYEEMRKGGEEFIQEMGSTDNASFILSGFKSLTQSWNSIDAFRIDKYMFLIRIMLRNVIKKQINTILNDQILFEDNIFMKSYLKDIRSKKKNSTDQKIVQSIDVKANGIEYIISVCFQSVGLFLHICDIYLEELKLVMNNFVDEKFKASIYHDMIKPFIKWSALIKDQRIIKSIHKDIFKRLLNEIILKESFSTQKSIIKHFIESLLKLSTHFLLTDDSRIIIEEYKKKLDELCGKCQNRIKRKVVGFDKKLKRVKYEMTAKTPFVRCIIPLPII